MALVRVEPNLSLFRRAAGERPRIYGHRGARAHAPENTLRAFALAIEHGADGVELDVRMTVDGTLVVAHDDAIAFPDGAGARLSRLTFGQLRAGNENPETYVPTLEEALAFRRETGALLNVELKSDALAPSWMTERAVEMLCRDGIDGIVLSSFDPRMVFSARRSCAELPTALLVHARQRFTPRALHHYPGAYRWGGASGVHPQHTLLDDALLRALHGEGALVNSWTVNDESEARRLAGGGIDGLITDDPMKLVAALEKPRPPHRGRIE